eukprot:g2830.t1
MRDVDASATPSPVPIQVQPRAAAPPQMPALPLPLPLAQTLDCYPYTFSPLLLFAQSTYFDKGYSNFDSVARFFAPAVGNEVDMLQNVLHERKNMLYEDLLHHVTEQQMLVTCCIDAHFTAFQVLPNRCCLYYDPLSASLSLVSGDSYDKLVGFLLLKCNYGDSQHIVDHGGHYTGAESNRTRRMLYDLWKRINKLTLRSLYGVRFAKVPIDLDRYLLVNASTANPRLMSTQLTGNTCYFQVYLFAVFCKAGAVALAPGGTAVELDDEQRLERVTRTIARFLLEFFVEDSLPPADAGKGGDATGAAARVVMRPLTNSNFVIDFYRFRDAPYFAALTGYLRHLGLSVPNYELQYERTLRYFRETKTLHGYGRFSLTGAMPSTPNTKSLQPVFGVDDGIYKLARSNYYKYRACNLMFGFHAGILRHLSDFCEFNALRKNQLLAFSAELGPLLRRVLSVVPTTKYRDYYFLPQFEAGQAELVDAHHYTYLLDICALSAVDDKGAALVAKVNHALVEHLLFSTQKRSTYDKIMATEDFVHARKWFGTYLASFMSPFWLREFVALGFPDVNPKEKKKDINSLTAAVFYSHDFIQSQSYRMEYEFEKEMINNMARTQLRHYAARFEGGLDIEQTYKVHIMIGFGFTYTKYNTLMHFLSVVEAYWHNPDLNNIQVFGKDIRTLLVLSSQKLFFDEGAPGYYHYGPFQVPGLRHQRGELDLAVASSGGHAAASVMREKRTGSTNHLILTDRVYEHGYLQRVLDGVFSRAAGVRLKTDNVVINLSLLSLMLDLGLYEKYAALLNLPFLRSAGGGGGGGAAVGGAGASGAGGGSDTGVVSTRQLQVEVANTIHEFDRRNEMEAVTRLKVEELLFECSYKFLVNKGFPVYSPQNKLIQELNADPAYQQHVLLCKINMSLCQINKSVEVDYYKLKLNGAFRTVIPQNFQKSTGEYLEKITRQYTFAEANGLVEYDGLPLFDLRSPQPEVHLYSVRFDSATDVQSMVKYIEVRNAFRAADAEGQYLLFIADNVLRVDAGVAQPTPRQHDPTHGGADVSIRINKIAVEVATTFFNEAISFVPCFKYADSEDMIFFCSQNIRYLVDSSGQFCTDYYGMRHELIGCIKSEEGFVDLNDEHNFTQCKLSELLTESKTVIYAPDYLLQVPSRQQLINLLDLAIHIRNVSFFILVLFLLRRSSIKLEYIEREAKVVKISGPWREAILYVLDRATNAHYDAIFQKQFFDLNQHEALPLEDFIDRLCENFTKYQSMTDDGTYTIVPTAKQKAFLQRIICAEECFHFSEVGSGKTKVILPLLCQMFLSNNAAAHEQLKRGGELKHVLVILVPEHLVEDARSQVFRYCLNLNFREEYRVYDDIFALLHNEVQLGGAPISGRYSYDRSSKRAVPPRKQIFVTSFNQFKRALTDDRISNKVWPHRKHILVVADEVDDFLERDKLVFKIASNKASNFDRPTLALYFEVARAAYLGDAGARVVDALIDAAPNPTYWRQLLGKFRAIHAEIQDASRSVNKSFGIFTPQTLRHCSTNIAHDIEGYKSLIARPYESVNRAMPGSYYSDVERTIYLTYVILREDIAKYDELFQEERKFISFEYWQAQLSSLDYDDLVYGHTRLSEIWALHPETRDGVARFLYEIILRRMEIRDRSRSVNSVDVVFNFDCIGFTGTPFIDNYPTFAYINAQRDDEIPDLIDRNFYVYASDALSQAAFEERFARFQGTNSRVLVEWVPSEFVREAAGDEMAILEHVFAREARVVAAAGVDAGRDAGAGFNALVDLCGVFKRSTIHDVRDLLLRHYGPDRFHYVYHIGQADSSDRVLSVRSDQDVQFDEEFYKALCKSYGAALRERVFFFVDNRNVIGKDIPFQLIYQRRFEQPLFIKSAVLAHDVDDFSKIWQAMGRSRTMNATTFSIYKSAISPELLPPPGDAGPADIKAQGLTRELYVRNCDRKMAGNLSSIYQTLIALHNLAGETFYYCDTIVNSFLDAMQQRIGAKVAQHESQLVKGVLGARLPARILQQILARKFQRSAVPAVAAQARTLTTELVESVVRDVVQQKYEQREPSGGIGDDVIRLLSGEQHGQMEISYTKQQQKQRQKQQNKNKDADTMAVFDQRHQIHLNVQARDYYAYARAAETDVPRTYLGLPLSVPILELSYAFDGARHGVCVYPTLQFLYSHHVRQAYVTPEVKATLNTFDSAEAFVLRFRAAAEERAAAEPAPTRDGAAAATSASGATDGDIVASFGVAVACNHIRASPLYSLAALAPGVYVVGMKDQFNRFDLDSHPLAAHVQYVSDEMGFILHDSMEAGVCSAASIDRFGPYGFEQYLLMELLSKQEVAANALEYYARHRDKLRRGLEGYGEQQGKGFVCWRFLMQRQHITVADGAADGGGASVESAYA